ncbi:PTS sugar transporter subunit IIB [Salibacterium aidingense]|uniref:PTS sugar transporter subunit IIB n=1 Tax=Salibacterium aidingense TaxID=384933 RepID=UPI0004025944|nr:PTS sugar transporter subunit IIB [Salibacterium aidingense]
MKKIVVVCGNGLGSSMIVEMNVKNILQERNVEADVSHTDLTTAKTETADLFIGSEDILGNLDDGSRNIALLNNLLDKEELRRVLEEKL